MQTATERCHRAVIAATLASLPEPPLNWSPEYDLLLVRALLSGGGGLDQAIEGTGYAASTCWSRLSRLIPKVMSHDAKTALLAELEARTEQKT